MTDTAAPTIKHIWIGSIDIDGEDKEDGSKTVKAQYNPATLEITQNVPWKKPDAANKGGGPAAAGPPKDPNFMALEFTGAEGRGMTVELLFDAYEDSRKPARATIQENVSALEYLASPRDPTSTKENERRPHHCVVVWGAFKFKCVIENLTTKYTMFDTDGTPLRATCTVKLKEATRVDRKKK